MTERVDYRKLLWKYMRGVIECEGVAHIGSNEEWEPAEWAELQAIYDMPFEYLPPTTASVEEQSVAERPIAEVIGWQFSYADVWPVSIYRPPDGSSVEGNPEIDDLLDWLSGQGCNLDIDAPLNQRPVILTVYGVPLAPTHITADTLYGAVEAAVRAVADGVEETP